MFAWELRSQINSRTSSWGRLGFPHLFSAQESPPESRCGRDDLPFRIRASCESRFKNVPCKLRSWIHYPSRFKIISLSDSEKIWIQIQTLFCSGLTQSLNQDSNFHTCVPLFRWNTASGFELSCMWAVICSGFMLASRSQVGAPLGLRVRISDELNNSWL